MPRRVQDILSNQNRSIRKIPIEKAADNEIRPQTPSKGKGLRDKEIREAEAEVLREEIRESKAREAHKEEEPVTIHISRQPLITSPLPARRSGGLWWWTAVTFGVVVLVAGVGYVASVYFARATFTIVPRSVPLTVNSTYIAQNNNPPAGVLPYDLVVIQSAASTTVPASDSISVSTKSSGKLSIYNTYSTEAQRLIAGTRLTNDSGLIYRTTGSVTIPGYKTENGKTIAGSATIGITADDVGQEYNLPKSESLADFRVIAFKGTPRYSGFYGKLASDLEGGFKGTKKGVSPTLLASSTELLKSKLGEALLAKAKESVPSGYVAYDNGFISSYTQPQVSGSDPKYATISIKGTVYGILFKREALVNKLAGNESEVFKNYPYDAVGLESLEFSIANAKDFSPEKRNTLIAKLKGSVDLVGSIPSTELKNKLSGLDLSETQKVLKSYAPIIKTGSGELVPPWSKVPTDPDKIAIVVEKIK